MNIRQTHVLIALSILYLSQDQVSICAAQSPVLVPQKAMLAPVPSSQQIPPLAPPRTKTSNQTTEKQDPSEFAPNAVSNEDSYPLVSKMEVITFGKEKKDLLLSERLAVLEQEVFHQTYPEFSLFDRTQKLKLTILGPDQLTQEELSTLVPLLSSPVPQSTEKKPNPEMTYFELVANDADNQMGVDVSDLPAYALQLLNKARTQLNFPPLISDEIANKVAEAHIEDLYNRKVVSHISKAGENPDLRYTIAGGAGALTESLALLKPELVKKNEYTRALVARAFKLLLEKQDDRDALLSPNATGFGFAMRLLPGEKRAIVCMEVSTVHGTISSAAAPIGIGEKIVIEGNVESPYKFAKITVAWEGLSDEMPETADEVDEALPYFPPLDYVAYAHKSEHDYGAAKTALRMGLFAGVIAGGLFVPPVALAAPLVMMAPGGSDDPKPMSDIPVHSGVKIEGSNFSGKIPLNNGGKAGIYYVTVWAYSGTDKLVPISRRAFVLKEQNISSEEMDKSRKIAKKGKQSKKDKQELERRENELAEQERDS